MKKKNTAAVSESPVRYDFSLLTDEDIYLFNEGSHFRLYEKLGSHVVERGGETGVYFSVWAPNAERVCLIGDFNGWDRGSHPLRTRASSGIWEGFVRSEERRVGKECRSRWSP